MTPGRESSGTRGKAAATRCDPHGCRSGSCSGARERQLSVDLDQFSARISNENNFSAAEVTFNTSAVGSGS